MNQRKKQLHFKKRRGIATVVGALIFTILMVATFSVLGPSLEAQTDMIDSSHTLFDTELKKQQEEFIVVASTDENRILKVDVHNTGQNSIEVPSLWITVIQFQQVTKPFPY